MNSSLCIQCEKQKQTLYQQMKNIQIYLVCQQCAKICCRNCYILHPNHYKIKITSKEKTKMADRDKRSLSCIDQRPHCIEKIQKQNSFHEQSTNKDFTNFHKNVQILCQQCEKNNSNKYCESCEQYLCKLCSQKIHNKGKRAKHEVINNNIEKIKKKTKIYIIAQDIKYYIRSSKMNIQNFTQALTWFFQEENIIQNLDQCLFFIQKSLNFNSQKEKITIIEYQSTNIEWNDVITLHNRYPFLQKLYILGTKQGLKLEKQMKKPKEEKIEPFPSSLEVIKLSGRFDELDDHSSIDNSFQQQDNSKFSGRYQNNQSILTIGNISGIKSNTHNSSSLYININMSTSTDNSHRKKNKKPPIPFLQPYRHSKNEKNKFQVQKQLRNMAKNGILMIRKQKASKFLLSSSVIRQFIRNIGETYISYISMSITSISIQCIAWIIQSIRIDCMTPHQKLILSRFKESFDIKINSKMWLSIVKYFQSNAYQNDINEFHERTIPVIFVKKVNDEYLLHFKEQWDYDDQAILNDDEVEWKQFKTLITQYFRNKTQISGGRYGCVQYAKINGPPALSQCTLGKISLFVQQAINRGIIRYHKTLLVSNSEIVVNFGNGTESFDKDMQQLQKHKDIKISIIQLSLIDLLLESNQGIAISLAQLPLNLKKKIYFDYNLIQLGFPKLKNLLNSITDKLNLQTTKSHVVYLLPQQGMNRIQKFKENLFQQYQKFLGRIVQITVKIVSNYQNIVIDELYKNLNKKLGFVFDFKIYNVPEFSQFILYYCHNSIDIQFISGILLAFSKFLPTNENLQYTEQNYPISYSQSQNKIQYNEQSNPINLYSVRVDKMSEFEKFGNNNQQMMRMYPKSVDLECVSQIGTPKFNSSMELYEIQNNIAQNWGCHNILLSLEKQNQLEEIEEYQNQQDYRSIYNILDEQQNSKSKNSQPRNIVIQDVNAQSSTISKIDGFKKHTYFQLEDSFGFEKHTYFQLEDSFGFDHNSKQQIKSQVKTQKNRAYSINQAPTIHQRKTGINTTSN